MKYINNKQNKGQGLLEMVLALAVLLMVVLALVSLATVSIRNSDFSKKKVQSSQLSQEIMEKIRGYRDNTDWTTFVANCDNRVVMGISDPPVPFGATVDCINGGTDLQTVSVIVFWTDGAKTHQSELISNFSKWQ